MAFGRTYLDSNVFIYSIEGSPPFQEASRRVLDVLAAEGQVPVTSEYTIAECIIGARKAKLPPIEDDYLRLFADETSVQIHALSRDFIVAAARLGGDIGLRLGDAIHVAAAVAAGCQTFVTNDYKLKLPQSLKPVWLVEPPIPPAGS